VRRSGLIVRDGFPGLERENYSDHCEVKGRLLIEKGKGNGKEEHPPE